MIDYKKEEEKIKRQTRQSHKEIFMVIIGILVLGCFIPFQRDTKSDFGEDGYHESYNYPIIEYAKVSQRGEQACPYGASDCDEVYGYVVDALIFSNHGWVNGTEKPGKVVYVSKSKKLYDNPKSASIDQGDGLINDITFKDSVYEVSGHSYSTTNCYAYGLFCPDDLSQVNSHESITFNTGAEVRSYTSNCERYNEDGYAFFNCSHGDYKIVSIESILK